MIRDIEFGAMGCSGQVAVAGDSASLVSNLLAEGVRAVEQLEARWSRFRADSDVSQINKTSGDWVQVHPSTLAAVQMAVSAHQLTNGAFDALVGAALVDNGYPESFTRLGRRGGSGTKTAQHKKVRAVAVEGAIDVDERSRSVRIPRGAQLDLGGIGKGWAGDVVCEALLAHGATGVMVNLGGDVKVAGIAPDGVWHVELDLPAPVGKTSILLASGAVAVSATSIRTWSHRGATWHHLIVPQTRLPAVFHGTAAVIAGAGWWAEALTKVALCTGGEPRAGAIEDLGRGAHGLVIPENGGAVTTTSRWSEFVVKPEHHHRSPDQFRIRQGV